MMLLRPWKKKRRRRKLGAPRRGFGLWLVLRTGFPAAEKGKGRREEDDEEGDRKSAGSSWCLAGKAVAGKRGLAGKAVAGKRGLAGKRHHPSPVVFPWHSSRSFVVWIRTLETSNLLRAKFSPEPCVGSSDRDRIAVWHDRDRIAVWHDRDRIAVWHDRD
jgi:hypothetical protein